MGRIPLHGHIKLKQTRLDILASTLSVKSFSPQPLVAKHIDVLSETQQCVRYISALMSDVISGASLSKVTHRWIGLEFVSKASYLHPDYVLLHQS